MKTVFFRESHFPCLTGAGGGVAAGDTSNHWDRLREG